MRRLLVVALFAFAAVPAALAAGPSPGTADQAVFGPLAYHAVAYGTRTDVWLGSRKTTFAGRWGIPLVTYSQDAGGLSHDGRTLVLAQADVAIRRVTRFLVLDAKRLTLRRELRLRGDFAFDALSPRGRTLYLIQRVSPRQIADYRVRAVDLGTGRLLPRVIADKRQASWTMRGMPLARATGPGGRWEYTLYSQPGNYPFVHALDTVSRTAVCIGLPWDWRKPMDAPAMRVRDGKLVIELGLEPARYVLDTTTLRLVATPAA